MKKYLVIIMFFFSLPLFANNAEYLSISGVIRDIDSKKTIANVNISIDGSTIGTVSNDEGFFTLKVKTENNTGRIKFDHIGYANVWVPFTTNITDTVIYMASKAILLNKAIVYTGDAYQMVKEAIGKIEQNYTNKPNLLTGFYRETLQKRKTYIGVSEAIVNIYKTPYGNKGSVNNDRVQIFKGRKLLSEKKGDTLAVKLQGGPTLSVNLDIVKNPDIMLKIEDLPDYKFTITGSTLINNRHHYIVAFIPVKSYLYPLYKGALYIDADNLTITRANLFLDMDNEKKATEYILTKKPAGLKFKPEEVSFLITYKENNGRSQLNYVRNDLKFKCDWKRRLFATNYSIVSEMVVIESNDKDVKNIPYRQAFNEKNLFSDKVDNFQDPGYWEQYNIIEPTESLDKAVNKLKK